MIKAAASFSHCISQLLTKKKKKREDEMKREMGGPEPDVTGENVIEGRERKKIPKRYEKGVEQQLFHGFYQRGM